MAIDITLIKQLRDLTSAGVADCRMALEEAGGDLAKAQDILRQKGLERAAKKSEREIKAGQIFAYIHGATALHQGGRTGALVSLGCETDFVAKTEDFQTLGKEISMQVAAMSPASVEELLGQTYIRDAQMTVKDLVKAAIAKLGENIKVRQVANMANG